MGDGVRPRRAVHGRGQANGAGYPEWVGARGAGGFRLPDGIAVDGGGEAVLDRKPAVAAAGGGDRRRADRDRYRDGEHGVLRAAGRKIRGAVSGAGDGARGGGGGGCGERRG